MFSCMPFLSPILVSHSNNTREALGIIVPFSLGRIFSYILIAIVAFLSSALVKKMLDDNHFFNLVLGMSTIFMGAYLLYKSFNSLKACARTTPLIKNTRLNALGLFAIGATMSLNPCAPIMTLLAVAANSSNVYSSIGFGLFFGIGAVIFSILFYGFIVSKVIKGLIAQFSSYKLVIERIAALLLMIVGASILNGILIL